MSGHVTQFLPAQQEIASSGELAQAISAVDFRGAAATIIGLGNMGMEYLKVMEALQVKTIRVVGRSAKRLAPLRGREGIHLHEGGFESFSEAARPDELGIIATPIPALAAAARKLLSLGFRRILIEKPVSLYSKEIEDLAELFQRNHAVGVCAYNRVAYPSFLECRWRMIQEGGATSCTYTFTEMVSSDWERRFPQEELNRWGIANSLHPIGMAHGLIGAPQRWSGFRAGALQWHPTGSVFVGSGLSERGVPFSYHADWSSTGRWSVEVHTERSSYRLCPLEKLMRRQSAKGDWEEVPLHIFSPQVKVGFVEQVAALLDRKIQEMVPLVSLREAAALTRYAEDLFGYEKGKGWDNG